MKREGGTYAACFDACRPPEYTGIYGAATAMTYREPLPEGCPPDNAEEIIAPRVVYRLVRNNPPTGDDFRSQRSERPDRVFHDVTECRAAGSRYSPASRPRKGGLREGT